MKLQALFLVLFLSSARGLIDCRTACRSCRSAKEAPELLSILCAMCQECKARRRDRLTATEAPPPPPSAPLMTQVSPWRGRTIAPANYITEVPRYITEARQYISEAPRYIPAVPNSSQQGRVLRQNEPPQGCPQPPACPEDAVLETLAPCVVPPPQPTTSVPPAPCPPVTDCVKRTQPCSSCCMPMMPCYMSPCMSQDQTASPAPTQRYIDVYVGIPTDVKLRRNLNLRTGESLPGSNTRPAFKTRLRQHNIMND